MIMLTRLLTATAAGAFVTACLLLLMHSLISIQPSALGPDRTRIDLVWATAREPEHVNVIDRLDFDREKLTKTLLPPVTTLISEGGPGLNVHISRPKPPSSAYVMKEFPPTDGPLVAMVRVLPQYPASANGREGYVVVQFDVMANGQVNNIVVVESSARIFEKPALRAAQRSRYRARVVDGVPLTSTGIQTLYRFEMEQN
jgi:protein TonB